MSRQLERTIERLEDRLEIEDDPDERKALLEEIRELGRELADEERWRELGRDRGWG